MHNEKCIIAVIINQSPALTKHTKILHASMKSKNAAWQTPKSTFILSSVDSCIHSYVTHALYINYLSMHWTNTVWHPSVTSAKKNKFNAIVLRAQARSRFAKSIFWLNLQRCNMTLHKQTMKTHCGSTQEARAARSCYARALRTISSSIDIYHTDP